MKKSALNLLTFAASLALLASCGPSNSESSAPVTSDPVASETVPDGDSSISTEPVVEVYKIVIRSSNGLNVTADKSEAPAGDLVTLTVSAEEGFSLKSIMLNGDASKITKESDTKYTFVMPDTSAVITTTVDVEGDAVVTGDVATVLEPQEDGTFKGTVTCVNDSNIAIKVGSVEYSFVDIDDNYSFGNYEAGRKTGCTILLNGNATYEITVNPSAELPVIIYRTGVDHAPATVDELLDLFNGDYSGRGLLDGGAYYLRDLVGVNYRNYVTNVEYTWEKYADGSSLGVANNPLEDEPSIVYRAISGDEYVVVDNYVEAVLDGSGVYYDDSVKNDTFEYSAKYGLDASLDEENDPLRCYKTTPAYALAEIDTPSHNMYSISREIAWGYRIGFTVEDDCVGASVKLTPTMNEDGSFEVDVYSWQNYDPNATHATHTKVERNEYKIHLEFNADSSLHSGTYLKNYYDETTWNFNSNDYENGGTAKENTKPVVKRKSSFEYTFGTPKTGSKADIDLTPYFIASISDVHVTHSDYPTDSVQLADVIDQSRYPGQKSADDQTGGYNSLLSFTASPSTALDRWQYGVVDSSDKSIIGLGTRMSYCWEALKKGKATVSVGNHLGNVLGSVEVTVINDVQVTGYYVSSMDSLDDAHVTNSSSIKMYTSEKLSVYLWAGPANCDPEPTITASNPKLKVTLSERVKPTVWNISTYPAFIMTLDASEMDITGTETVTLKVEDPMFDSNRGNGYSTISVTITKGADVTWPTSIVGTTWVGDEEYTDARAVELGYSSGFMHVESSLSFTGEIFSGDYKKVTLTATYNGRTRNIDLGYTYDPSATVPVRFSAGGAYDISVGSSGDKVNGYIGLQYCIATYNGMDDVTYDDVVGIEGDGEDYVTAYQWFKRAA